MTESRMAEKDSPKMMLGGVKMLQSRFDGLIIFCKKVKNCIEKGKIKTKY